MHPKLICTYNFITIICIIVVQKDVVVAPPTVRESEHICMQLYHRVQATVSVVWKAEVVHYSGSAIALHIWRLQLVHRAVSVIELRSVIGSVR